MVREVRSAAGITLLEGMRVNKFIPNTFLAAAALSETLARPREVMVVSSGSEDTDKEVAKAVGEAGGRAVFVSPDEKERMMQSLDAMFPPKPTTQELIISCRERFTESAFEQETVAMRRKPNQPFYEQFRKPDKKTGKAADHWKGA